MNNKIKIIVPSFIALIIISTLSYYLIDLRKNLEDRDDEIEELEEKVEKNNKSTIKVCESQTLGVKLEVPTDWGCWEDKNLSDGVGDLLVYSDTESVRFSNIEKNSMCPSPSCSQSNFIKTVDFDIREYIIEEDREEIDDYLYYGGYLHGDDDKLHRLFAEISYAGIENGEVMTEDQKEMVSEIISSVKITSDLMSEQEFDYPLAYEEEGGCPFEYCSHGKWATSNSVKLRRFRDNDAPVISEVGENEVVEVLTARYFTRRPLVAKAIKDHILFFEHEVKKGEVIYQYTIWPEGSAYRWTNGEMIQTDQIYIENGFSRVTGNNELLEDAENEWWVKIKDDEGNVGWVMEDDNFMCNYRLPWEEEDGVCEELGIKTSYEL